MSFLSDEESYIIKGTWQRYSANNLEGDVLFFTSSVYAANKYKEVHTGNIFKFQISGRLKLINVAKYIKKNNFQFTYNIIGEDDQRKDSTPETAEQERQFYRTLIKMTDITDIDGFFTPESLFHHEEMVLLNKDIIENLKNFEPFIRNKNVTPQKNPALKLCIGEERRQVFLEKRLAHGNLFSRKRLDF